MDLSELRTWTRAKCDEQASGFITDDILDLAINQAGRWVYRKLVQTFQGYGVREGTTGNGGKFNTVAGTQGYSLPSDTRKVVRVEHRPSSSTDDNEYRKMDKLNIANDRGESFFPVREGYSPQFGYFTAGSKIYFRPVPASVFTVRIWDVPKWTTLVDDDDEPVTEDDWDDLICELAALECLGQSGEPLFEERFKLFGLQNGLLEDTAGHRDFQPEQMVITDDQDFT